MSLRDVVTTSEAASGPADRLLGRSAGMVGMAGSALFLVALVALHVLRPDLGIAADYVSDYANGSFGALFATALYAHGIGNLALAAGLALELAPSRRGVTGSLLLAVAAVGIVLAATFPTDPAGAAQTTVGRVHGAAATGAFPVEVLALFLLGGAFTVGGRWRRATWQVAGIVGLALIWLEVAIIRGGAPGIPERAALVMLAVWELAASVHLIRQAGGTGGSLPMQTHRRDHGHI